MRKIFRLLLVMVILLGSLSFTQAKAEEGPKEKSYEQMLYSEPIQYIKWLGFGIDWLDENEHLFQWGSSTQTRWANEVEEMA